MKFKSRNFDKLSKSLVISRSAMVASSHPLASSTGMQSYALLNHI